MPSAVSFESFVDAVDRMTRRLVRNMECCDRMLVACCNLTPAQAYSLMALHEREDVTMNELATEMRLHGTTMTRMVDSLVEKGLAERRQDPEDRRIIRVSLSPQGRETVEQWQQVKQNFLAVAFADLSVEERQTILKALGKLSMTIDELGARCCSC